MTFALTLLVLLSPGDESLARPIAAAARETLGAEAVVEVRISAQAPDEAAALELARGARSGAVSVINWDDATKLRVRVRLYDQTTAHWLERELSFAPNDALDEKARALGFTLASMLPEGARTAAAVDVAKADATKPPAAIESTPADASTEPKQVAEPKRSAPSPVPASPAPAPLLEPPSRRFAAARVVPPSRRFAAARPWTFAVDLAASGLLAIDGEGTVGGGELAGQYRLSDHFALRAGAALRLGHVETLEADLITLDLGPGLAWRSSDASPAQRFALALHLDGFARLQRLSRPARGERPAENHGRFVPGVGVSIEPSYLLTDTLALFADAGVQVLLGETEVFRKDRQVTGFAPVDLRLALGGRARF